MSVTSNIIVPLVMALNSKKCCMCLSCELEIVQRMDPVSKENGTRVTLSNMELTGQKGNTFGYQVGTFNQNLSVPYRVGHIWISGAHCNENPTYVFLSWE